METTDKKIILVPWDFSEKAEYALEHAINLGKNLNTDVGLLHIVKKEKEVEDATGKLNITVEETRKKYGVKAIPLVKVGNIFTTI